jgi:hypothetical protein
MTNIGRGTFALLALTLSWLPTAAVAEFKPSAELQSACRSDAFKLCKPYLMNMDKVTACLTAKKAEANPRCRAQYELEMKSAKK